jgi:serine/threonine protein phosphatase PrpC
VKEFFQRLFGQKPVVSTEIPTRPIPPEEYHVGLEKNHHEPLQLIVGCGQSIGRQREHNEDALFTLSTTLSSQQNNIPFGLYIVADGMGGHQYGEVASEIAVRNMASHVIQKLYIPLLNPIPTSPDESLQEIMQTGVQDAHQAITKQVPGGGTTLTAVLILGDQMTIAHVGDSRAYHVGNNGLIEPLTRDHSLVSRLVELGQITIDEAAIHPQRNVLYRALGQGEPFDPDVKTTQMPDSGYLFLCSDGLWGVVPDEQIHHLIMQACNPEDACQDLVDAANHAGGPDNITAILVRLPS